MFPAKAVSTLGKRVLCTTLETATMGGVQGGPFAGGRGVASIRMVCLRRKVLSPFWTVPLHSVHVGLHLS